MTTENSFKTGDRVRRITDGKVGTVIGAFQLTEDKYASRKSNGRWTDKKVQAKGSWSIKVHWDWEKEKYGDKVPEVSDPQFAKWATLRYQWHQLHARWMQAHWIEKAA